jgi:deoxyribonuclease-4
MSIAGGHHKAVEAARQAGCDCVQLFSKNNNHWNAKPIDPEQVAVFQQTLTDLLVGFPLVHTSYLINVASPDNPLWTKSIDALIDEVQRAQMLGISRLVLHPGSYTTSSEQMGLKRVVQALREVERQTPESDVVVLLENTSGQGSNLGHRFEHLGEILDGLGNPRRFGVCLDTCHAFAAGYPLETPAEYQQSLDQLLRFVGLAALQAIHLNDSKQPLGSRKDRHEHIGHGRLGLEPFRHLLHDDRLRSTPMYLETPKQQHDDGRSWDQVNLATLRALVADAKTCNVRSAD